MKITSWCYCLKCIRISPFMNTKKVALLHERTLRDVYTTYLLRYWRLTDLTVNIWMIWYGQRLHTNRLWQLPTFGKVNLWRKISLVFFSFFWLTDYLSYHSAKVFGHFGTGVFGLQIWNVLGTNCFSSEVSWHWELTANCHLSDIRVVF